MKDTLSDWLIWAVGGVVAACTWLVRKVLTNEKEIALLQQQAQQHHEDFLRATGDLKDSVDKQRDATMELLGEMAKRNIP